MDGNYGGLQFHISVVRGFLRSKHLKTKSVSFTTLKLWFVKSRI